MKVNTHYFWWECKLNSNWQYLPTKRLKILPPILLLAISKTNNQTYAKGCTQKKPDESIVDNKLWRATKFPLRTD